MTVEENSIDKKCVKCEIFYNHLKQMVKDNSIEEVAKKIKFACQHNEKFGTFCKNISAEEMIKIAHAISKDIPAKIACKNFC